MTVSEENNVEAVDCEVPSCRSPQGTGQNAMATHEDRDFGISNKMCSSFGAKLEFSTGKDGFKPHGESIGMNLLCFGRLMAIFPEFIESGKRKSGG